MIIVKLKRIPLFPNWVDGVTLYPFIFIRDREYTSEQYSILIKHEKVHIRQQLEGWLIVFYVKYLYWSWKYGYKDNPYEVEARLESERV